MSDRVLWWHSDIRDDEILRSRVTVLPGLALLVLLHFVFVHNLYVEVSIFVGLTESSIGQSSVITVLLNDTDFVYQYHKANYEYVFCFISKMR